MSDKLLFDPNELYKLYNYNDIIHYYNFDFLANFNSIEIDIFYDILNSLTTKALSNLNNYIFKQWSLTKKMAEVEYVNIELTTYTLHNVSSKDELNHKLKNFIQGDTVLSLYIMNQMLKFLYPF